MYGFECHHLYLFGWASEFLNDARPNFSAIEKATGLDHLRVHYRLASHGVHANPKGITDRLSQPDYTDALIAGPSVFGLESPITCTAVTATQLFATLGTQWSSIDSLIAVKILGVLRDRVSAALEGVDIGLC